LEGLPFEPVERSLEHVEETAGTLVGNAELKARSASASGWAIASDGGLEVPALGPSWDPVLTRRQGQARLAELAAGLGDRRVSWREAICLARGGEVVASWERDGTRGVLAPLPWPPPGDLWVWDVFVFPQSGRRWSELDEAERVQLDLTWTTLRADVRGLVETFGGQAT